MWPLVSLNQNNEPLKWGYERIKDIIFTFGNKTEIKINISGQPIKYSTLLKRIICLVRNFIKITYFNFFLCVKNLIISIYFPS